MSNNLLLDTCGLIWLSEEGGGELSEETIEEINEAKFVYLSAISA